MEGTVSPGCTVQLDLLPTTGVHHPLSPWRTQCAQRIQLGWMIVHGMSKHRPDVAKGVVLALVLILGNVVP